MSGFKLLGWIPKPLTPPSSKTNQLFSTLFITSKTTFLFNSISTKPLPFFFLRSSFLFLNMDSPSPSSSSSSSSSFSSSNHRLFNRQRSLHQILGGGFIADVMLWRRRDLTVGILVATISSWVVFEKSGYTLISLVSSVLLLLFAILFLWAKSAQILNRPPPPLPDLQLSEEVINEAAAFIRSHINALLSVSQDISLGKDSKLFIKVAACMLLTSIVGGWTDFLTLSYTSVIVLLTAPALYEKYEDQIDTNVVIAYRELKRLYLRLDERHLSKMRNLITEKRKLS